MPSAAQVERYAARIGSVGTTDCRLDSLSALVRSHLLTVPFENLDIHLGRALRLDTRSLHHKIVDQRRGGYCYELNTLFAEFLRQLGYRVELLSCRIIRDQSMGPPFDHMALRVFVSGAPYLVDVGFGDSSVRPLLLEEGASLKERGNSYSLASHAEGMELRVVAKDGYRRGYAISLAVRGLGDFFSMHHHHQTSPRSWFTNARIAIQATSKGRISLIDGNYRQNGKRLRSVRLPSEYLSVLEQDFGIVLPTMPPNLSDRGLFRVQKEAIKLHRRIRARVNRVRVVLP